MECDDSWTSGRAIVVAMTVYDDYTDDEKQILMASMEAAAVAISAASPGRKEETVSEGFAAASFVLDSRANYVGNTLVSSIIFALEARVKAEEKMPNYVEVASRPDAGDWANRVLVDVVALLDAKATADEAKGYKAWLMEIATITAAAGKEDQGFLGRGGVAINDAERAAIKVVAEVLGVDA